jgi:hypothetical protein
MRVNALLEGMANLHAMDSAATAIGPLLSREAKTGTGIRIRKKRKSDKAEIHHHHHNLGPLGGVYFDKRSDGKLLPRIILPKIFKSDVRRDYAQMFLNVNNSMDKKMMQDYLNHYYRNDLVYYKRPHGTLMLF